MEKVRITQNTSGGVLWLVGWLFTIGFLNLGFLQGAAALFIWPAYLGYAFGPLLGILTKGGPS